MAKQVEYGAGNTKKAIAYLCNLKRTGERVSISEQRKEIKEYCKTQKYFLSEVYVDDAEEVYLNARPEFARLLSDLDIMNPDIVVFYSLDVFPGDSIDIMVARKKIHEFGAKCEFLYYEQNYISIGISMTEMFDEILFGNLRDKRGATIAEGIKRKKEYGIYTGHKIFGYIGEQDHRYRIDPVTGPIVVRIFRDYIDGKSMQTIANELNEEGYQTVRGKPFTVKTLWHTLHNRSYIGEYQGQYQGKYLSPADVMPALIKREDFDKVQELMEQRKHGQRGGRVEACRTIQKFDSEIFDQIYCESCGKKITWKRRMGEATFCCCGKSHSWKELEEKLTPLLEEINNGEYDLFLTINSMFYMEAVSKRSEEWLNRTQEEKERIEQARFNLRREIEEGRGDNATKERMDFLEKLGQNYLQEMIRIRKRKKLLDILNNPDWFVEQIRAGINNPRLRNKIFAFMINRIVVDDLKITVYMSIGGERSIPW